MKVKERKIVTLYDLAKMSNRNATECLHIAQEAKALRLQPEDTNIYVDVQMFQDHLDKIINEELKVLNGKGDKEA